jgi:transketolase N-terminal domain/subunit
MSTAIAPVEKLSAAELDQLCINTIRTLSIDAVQQANSGHPGTPMALAPLVYTIWNRALKFDPQDPIWPNRDRFVLSNGHASMLLWSALHLTGVQAVNADYERLGQPSVTLDDIRRFRQLDSKAPGHPEYHWVSGVETTTGPLGQGVATSVGMAIAEKWLAHRYNRPGFDIFNYNIYSVCGDGCLMEGIASEAASLAAHLGLDNLCWIYDNNHITIEGNTRIAFTEDVAGLNKPSRSFERPKAAPPSLFSTVISGTAHHINRTPPLRMESPSEKTKFGCARRPMDFLKMQSSLSPMACTTTSQPGSANVALQPDRSGRNFLSPTALNTQTSQRRLS